MNVAAPWKNKDLTYILRKAWNLSHCSKATERIQMDGADDNTWGLPPSVIFPSGSLSFGVSNECNHVVITTHIRLVRNNRWLGGNIKDAGQGSVTDEGGSGEDGSLGFLLVTSVKRLYTCIMMQEEPTRLHGVRRQKS